jgi:hypothetical protein
MFALRKARSRTNQDISKGLLILLFHPPSQDGLMTSEDREEVEASLPEICHRPSHPCARKQKGGEATGASPPGESIDPV